MDARFEVDKDSPDEIIVHIGMSQIPSLIRDLGDLLLAGVLIKKGLKNTAFTLYGKLEIEED